jgi:hypothetical protein
VASGTGNEAVGKLVQPYYHATERKMPSDEDLAQNQKSSCAANLTTTY